MRAEHWTGERWETIDAPARDDERWILGTVRDPAWVGPVPDNGTGFPMYPIGIVGPPVRIRSGRPIKADLACTDFTWIGFVVDGQRYRVD